LHGTGVPGATFLSVFAFFFSDSNSAIVCSITERFCAISASDMASMLSPFVFKRSLTSCSFNPLDDKTDLICAITFGLSRAVGWACAVTYVIEINRVSKTGIKRLIMG